MRFRVIANEMSARNRFLDQFWAFAHVAANQKKCGLGVVAVQQVEQLWGDGGIRPVIEGKCQLARRVSPANCGTEKLRAGIHRTVGGDASNRHNRARHPNDPRVHVGILAHHLAQGLNATSAS